MLQRLTEQEPFPYPKPKRASEPMIGLMASILEISLYGMDHTGVGALISFKEVEAEGGDLVAREKREY